MANRFLIISPFEDNQQSLPLKSSQNFTIMKEEESLFSKNALDKKMEKGQDIVKQGQKIIQNTNLLTEEEMPSNELTVEDLPF